MNGLLHGKTTLDLPWQLSSHSLRDIGLHYPGPRLFASMLVKDGSW